MEQAYFVFGWGVAGNIVAGPFGDDLDSATAYANDLAQGDIEDQKYEAAIVTQLPIIYTTL